MQIAIHAMAAHTLEVTFRSQIPKPNRNSLNQGTNVWKVVALQPISRMCEEMTKYRSGLAPVISGGRVINASFCRSCCRSSSCNPARKVLMGGRKLLANVNPLLDDFKNMVLCCVHFVGSRKIQMDCKARMSSYRTRKACSSSLSLSLSNPLWRTNSALSHV